MTSETLKYSSWIRSSFFDGGARHAKCAGYSERFVIKVSTNLMSVRTSWATVSTVNINIFQPVNADTASRGGDRFCSRCCLVNQWESGCLKMADDANERYSWKGCLSLDLTPSAGAARSPSDSLVMYYRYSDRTPLEDTLGKQQSMSNGISICR